jgi:hypothetical protein
MANAIFSNDEENQPIQPEESESREENSANNDDSGTPDDPLPPLGVLLIPGESIPCHPVSIHRGNSTSRKSQCECIQSTV